MKIVTLGWVLALFACGCSKQAVETNLGVIKLAQDAPAHFNVGGADWTITETLVPGGRPKITAESEWKVTQDDVSSSTVPADTKIARISK